jgi:hypothetical protein
MKTKIKKEVEVEIKFLKVRAGVRYWEDASVNDIEDEEGDLIPCRNKDNWCPIIDIETGIITNWEQGKKADIHYKVCDDADYYLLDEKYKEVLHKEGYVPECLAIDDNGYGDYIIIKVDENGLINNWKFGTFDVREDFEENKED